MRIVLQRVKEAFVRVDGTTISSIKHGMLILLGVEHDDNDQDMLWLIRKVINLRIFSDVEGKMNLPIADVRGSFLVVSQFTLHANSRKGNRPSYIRAANPEIAENYYRKFIECLKEETDLTVKEGSFGAMMDIHLINDGPVTIILDSKNKEL